MVERWDGIPRFYFLLFCLEATIKRNTWMRTISVTVMIIISKIAVLKVTWYQLCSKCFLDNYEAHWQRHLKDTLQMKILRTWINIHANSFFGKYHEMIMTMVPWKLSVAKKSEPVLSRASHQDISLIIVVFVSRTNLIYGGLSLWWNQ